MRAFLHELKRRNVVRVAIVYLIAAWLILQVADVMFPALNLPPWTVTAVAALILIGFPFALIFAWAFDMTPEGLKRESDIDRSQSAPVDSGKKLNQLIIGGLVLVVAVLLTDRLLHRDMPESGDVTMTAPAGDAATGAGIPKLSIAVLPFVNMSGDADNEYFSEGLSEELLNVLAQISMLHVAGRTSSFKFKGRNEDLRIIGEQLNVANVLEGSVRKSGRKVRITAQLIDTASGFQLWSDTYDRELTDIFAIQDEIAANVANALKVALLGDDGSPKASRGTDNMEAYELYLQGRYFREHQTETNVQKSIELLQQAIALDPDYAQAYAVLARSQSDWITAYSYGQDFRSAFRQVRANADKALALNDRLGEAYLSKAIVQTIDDRDLEGAKKTLEQGLRLEPGNADILSWYGGNLTLTGRFEQAIEVLERAVGLDPLAITNTTTLGDAYTMSGQLDAGLGKYQRVLELDPNVVRAHGRIGLVYLLEGDLDRAAAEYALEPVAWVRDMGQILIMHRRHLTFEWEAAVDRYAEQYDVQNAYQLAEIYSDAGERDKAFTWLQTAYDVYDPGLVWIRVSPFLANLHDDPRWSSLIAKLDGG